MEDADRRSVPEPWMIGAKLFVWLNTLCCKQHLRSVNCQLLNVLRCRLGTVGRRAFGIACPPCMRRLNCRNNSDGVTIAQALTVFMSALKTFLFAQYCHCPLKTPSTVPRIGPCGGRALRPPWPCVDDTTSTSTERISG